MARLRARAEALVGEVFVWHAAIALHVAHAEVVEPVRIALVCRLLEKPEALHERARDFVRLHRRIPERARKRDGAPRVKRLHVVAVGRALQERHVVLLERKEIPGERVVLLLRETAYLVPRLVEILPARLGLEAKLARKVLVVGDERDDELLQRTPFLRACGDNLRGLPEFAAAAGRARIEKRHYRFRRLVRRSRSTGKRECAKRR